MESIQLLGLSLAGGAILNCMPCVLPVLSLKIASLANDATRTSRATTRSAVATACGIIFSFWILAAVVLVLQATGRSVGWGIQFQSPAFVTFLCVVMALFCLNLWGLLEITAPERLLRIGLVSRGDGFVGDFLVGFFTTLMATPCSAPFLGTAVAFAVTQTAPTIFASFSMIGLGLALPYVLLAVFPRWVRLPRPGAWMIQVRCVLGFVLAVAVVWLLFVLSGQLPAADVSIIELHLVGLGLCVWLATQLQKHRITLQLVALCVAVSAVWSGAAADRQSRPVNQARTAVAWAAFDLQEATRRAARGELVFVDITADWCLTCKVNERLVLSTPRVVEAFGTQEVVAMRGDWTNPDPRIAALLSDYARVGIPFYLFLGPNGHRVLPEILTTEIVLDSLEEMASTLPPRINGSIRRY